MGKLRLGIIGTGVQGSYHIRCLMQGLIPQFELCALCDINPEKLSKAKELAGGNVLTFENADDLFAAKCVDAVIISTPHFIHPVLGIKALRAGLHIMVEKPAGVYTKQVRLLNEEAKKSDRVFGVMLNQRTNPLYAKLREMIREGKLGQVRRTNWIITDWYRSQFYYDSGEWRATWAGEGGGVLLNQNPHTLDLWQWICGMPKSVFAIADNGKFHDIEVEDDVSLIARYENGATGVYVTTTGDTPGTNRLEVTGDKGKAVIENGTLKFWELEIPESEFTKICTEPFGTPKFTVSEIEIEGEETKHPGILRNWAEAILHGEPLLAPGEDGMKAVQIINAIQLSAWKGEWVDIPVDEESYLEELNKRIAISKYHRGKEYEGC